MHAASGVVAHADDLAGALWPDPVTLVLDTVGADAGWMLMLLVRWVRRTKPAFRVVVLSCTQTHAHYAAVLRKLGIDLSADEAAGLLRVVTALGPGAAHWPWPSAQAVLDAASSAVQDAEQAVLLVDDVTTLAVHLGEHAAATIALQLPALAPTVLLAHQDAHSDGAAGQTGAAVLVPCLRTLASCVCLATPLVTGRAADVDGRLAITSVAAGERAAHFTVQDASVSLTPCV